jgi:hypothetical protein
MVDSVSASAREATPRHPHAPRIALGSIVRAAVPHDFEDEELGKIVPYGVYDVTANAGWVSVGITSDTAEFAVASIRRWLDEMGHEQYPHASELTTRSTAAARMERACGCGKSSCKSSPMRRPL